MLIRDILRVKGVDVHTIEPAATLDEVVKAMVSHNCGSLVVANGRKMLGIITERDVLKSCAAAPHALAEMTAAERMSRDVVTGRLTDSISDVMGLLTERRIRHLPVVDDRGELAGMISIGDVVKAQHDLLTFENHHLRTYLRS